MIKALSEIRKNILNWYPFEENSDILEIAGDWEKLDCNEKFDYIILLGVEKEKIGLKEVLLKLSRNLKEDGTILFSVENKLGLNILNGTDNIKLSKNPYTNQYTKREIEEEIFQAELGWTPHFRFYYPLPNYELPNIIFSDDYLPTEELIERDLTLYNTEKIISFDERDIYKLIIREDKKLFPTFANSFLVALSNHPISNQIKMITFGNNRKPEFRLNTLIYDKEVCKECVSDKSKKHYEDIKRNINLLNTANINILDSVRDDKIYSRKVNGDSFDTFLIKILKKDGLKELLKYIELFEKELKLKLKKSNPHCVTVFQKYKIDCLDIEDLYFVEDGFYDLIFQNTFYINGIFYFYDQEWYESNVPIEFIIFRAVIYNLNKLKEISIEQLWEELGIKRFIKAFYDLDKLLQSKISDKIIFHKIHKENRITIKDVYDEQIYLRYKQAQKINDLEEELTDLNNKLTDIKNSNSWKITKPLRDIKNILR
ncbi:MAG: hypothetical protein ACRC3H_26575 [Lachnospiraceae bacterium]